MKVKVLMAVVASAAVAAAGTAGLVVEAPVQRPTEDPVTIDAATRTIRLFSEYSNFVWISSVRGFNAGLSGWVVCMGGPMCNHFVFFSQLGAAACPQTPSRVWRQEVA